MSLLRSIKNFFAISSDSVKNLTEEEKIAVNTLMSDGLKANSFIRHEIEIQRIKEFINNLNQKGPK